MEGPVAQAGEVFSLRLFLFHGKCDKMPIAERQEEENDGRRESIMEKCAEFHGHECGGLTIGYKAALYAKELLDLDFLRTSRWCVFRKTTPAGWTPSR